MDDLTDFLWQMEILVLEEAPLYEIPQGSTDDPGGSARRHGPWPGSTCAAILMWGTWVGWVGLYFRDPPPGWNVIPAEWRSRLADDEDLAVQDAYGLLEQPDRWILEHADGHVQPYRTVEGEVTPQEQWSEGLRGLRESNVLGLLRFDSALVHALDAAGPGVQRAVALLAARRACEVSCLTDVPWVAQALTALTESRPLPPPFDDWDRAFATLRSDQQVPERMVLEAVPPERLPYRPATPTPGVQHEPVAMVRTAGTAHGPP